MRELVGKLRARYRALRRTDVTLAEWIDLRAELSDALTQAQSHAGDTATKMADAYWIETALKELLVKVEQSIVDLEAHALTARGS